jgi:hypothetical protein
MGSANTLSHCDNIDTANDNLELMLLPNDLFTHTIDVALADRIALSTPSDPLVLSVLQALDEGASLFPVPTGRTGSTRRESSTSRGISMLPRGPAVTLSPLSMNRPLGATAASSAPRILLLGTFGGHA